MQNLLRISFLIQLYHLELWARALFRMPCQLGN